MNPAQPTTPHTRQPSSATNGNRNGTASADTGLSTSATRPAPCPLAAASNTRAQPANRLPAADTRVTRRRPNPSRRPSARTASGLHRIAAIFARDEEGVDEDTGAAHGRSRTDRKTQRISHAREAHRRRPAPRSQHTAYLDQIALPRRPGQRLGRLPEPGRPTDVSPRHRPPTARRRSERNASGKGSRSDTPGTRPRRQRLEVLRETAPAERMAPPATTANGVTRAPVKETAVPAGPGDRTRPRPDPAPAPPPGDTGLQRRFDRRPGHLHAASVRPAFHPPARRLPIRAATPVSGSPQVGYVREGLASRLAGRARRLGESRPRSRTLTALRRYM